MSTRNRNRLPAKHYSRLVAASLVVGLASFAMVVLPAPVASAATDTVTICSGSGSLPAVVSGVASGDTINFSVSCSSVSPITIASTIDINGNLTIEGPGASQMVVSGGNAVAVFFIGGGVTATVSGLTIEGGNTISDGGGINNEGRLTVNDCTVSDNTAKTAPKRERRRGRGHLQQWHPRSL